MDPSTGNHLLAASANANLDGRRKAETIVNHVRGQPTIALQAFPHIGADGIDDFLPARGTVHGTHVR
jgi:hypothetical protein